MGKQKTQNEKHLYIEYFNARKIFTKHTIYVSLKWNHAKVSSSKKNEKSSNTKTQEKDQNS